MSRSPRLAVVALSALLALAISPLATLGQDGSPPASSPPVSTEPAASQVPTLAPATAPIVAASGTDEVPIVAALGAITSQQQICDWSGGTFDGSSCSLPTENLVDAKLVKAFGSDREMLLVEAAGHPVVLGGAAPEAGPVITRVTAIPNLELDGRGAKWLNQKQRSDDKSVVKSTQTKWDKVDEVGLVSLHLAEPVEARKLSDEGVLVVRLQHGDRTIDAGFVNRKPVFRNADGRKADGMAIFEDDHIDFIVANGLDGPFDVELVLITGDGLATGQSVGGPGGTDALIPTQPYAPVLVCGAAAADVDPSDTIDGETFGLSGMTYTLETPLIPEGLGELRPTFMVTLAPAGSRARTDAPDVVRQITPPARPVRRAITLSIDLSGEGLTGPTGYYFGENPFTVVDLSATLEPDSEVSAFDREAAVALLEEAGWVDTDGDGVLEADLADVAAELNRLTGGAFTESPIAWGWTGCGQDAHWASVQSSCRQPFSDQLRDGLASVTGEAPAALFTQPGSFANGFTGCTLFGDSEVFVATWLLAETYGEDSIYDPAVLDLFVSELGCVVSTDAPGEGLQLVGTCAEPPFEIFWDGSRGFGSYFAFAGHDLDIGQLADEVVAPILDPDLDGDGLTDRFDPDVDGDGLLNAVDADDDDDMVLDSQDWSPFDLAGYTSPSAFAALLQSLQAS